MSTQAYYKERLGFDPADTVAEHHREQRSQHGYEESLSKFKGQNENGFSWMMERRVENWRVEGAAAEEHRSGSTQAFWGCWAMFIEAHGRWRVGMPMLDPVQYLVPDPPRPIFSIRNYSFPISPPFFFFLLLILLFENSLWLWPFLRVTRSNGIRENRWYVRFYLAFSSPPSWIPSVGTPGRGETVRRNRREKEKRELHASRKLEFRIGSSDYTANGSIFFRSFTFCRLTRMFRGSSLGNSRGKIVRGSWWALIHGLECPLSIRENSSFPFFFLFFSRIFLTLLSRISRNKIFCLCILRVYIYIYIFLIFIYFFLSLFIFFFSLVHLTSTN